MPPPLASCVFAVFIFWLFRRYAREVGPVPASLWIPFFWVTINASRALAFWFADGTTASQSADESSGSFYDRNAYLILMTAGVLVLARRRIDWGRIIHDCRWLWILYAYYLLSIIWSPDPFVSFKRWFKASGDIIMILIMLTEADPVAAVRAIFVRCVYVLVPVSVLFIKYYPLLGRYLHPWTWKTFYCGVTTNKNALGILAMLGGLFLMWHVVDMYQQRDRPRSFRNLWPDLLVLGMCLWLLNLAGSSTATVCFIVGTAIFLGARRAWVKSNLKNLGWCVAGFGLLMLIFSVSPGFRGVVAGVLGRDATLTDRTLIWDAALNSGSNPIVGEGYEGYWLSGKGNQIMDEFHVDYVHNGYLDVYLNTGLIGVFLFAGMLYAAGRNATSHFAGGSPLGYLFMSLFWICLLFNYTEISFGRSNVFGFLISLIVVYGPFVAAHREVETAFEPDRDDATGRLTLGEVQNVAVLSRNWPMGRQFQRAGII